MYKVKSILDEAISLWNLQRVKMKWLKYILTNIAQCIQLKRGFQMKRAWTFHSTAMSEHTIT